MYASFVMIKIKRGRGNEISGRKVEKGSEKRVYKKEKFCQGQESNLERSRRYSARSVTVPECQTRNLGEEEVLILILLSV